MKYAVNTKTQEEYDTLVQAYEDIGWRWPSEIKPTNLGAYHWYEEETCVRFEDDFGYADKDWYESEGYTILTLKQALNKIKDMNKPMHNLQVGDIIKDVGGDFRRVLTAQGEGEYRTYGMSHYSDYRSSNDLKRHGLTYTAFELERDYFTLATEPKKKTVEQILSSLPEDEKETIRKAMK